jgi:hypothetical protein
MSKTLSACLIAIAVAACAKTEKPFPPFQPPSSPLTLKLPQPAKQFEDALSNNSTSPSYVMITVIDGRTNQARQGCTFANLLIGAIIREKGLAPQSIEEARRIALATPGYTYTFFKPEALANIRFDGAKNDLACAIIRAGHPAYMTDRNGQVREGQPNLP